MLVNRGRNTTSAQPRNKFVETALSYALTYASAVSHVRIESISVTIVADTDYYSQTSCSRSKNAPLVDQFVDFNVPLHQAHKTGLGSSAALVTALITTLVAHYAPSGAINVESLEEKYKLHNLAQAAHCAAQGKIGSGFDIAAATYGSCIYRRFSPSILEGLGAARDKGFSTRLTSIINDLGPSKIWDTSIDTTYSASIPKGLRLIMCDVECGSETVSMVKEVLSWRKERPEEALFLWETLQKGNEDLAMELHALALKSPSTPKDYNDLRNTIFTIRSLIREMSEKSSVPIEPKVQTDLLDACSHVDGVVGGVVPGAGGYDAIALLVENTPSVLENLDRFLQDYQVSTDDDRGNGIGKVRMLGVKQEDHGVKREELAQYQTWLR